MYQPYYQQSFQQPMPDFLRAQYQQTPQAPQQTDERIWVSSPAAADAYLMAPNSFVRLWDSSRPVFYEKRSDGSGRPYMETYEYKRKDSTPQEAAPSVDYTARFSKIEERLTALERSKDEGIHAEPQPERDVEAV